MTAADRLRALAAQATPGPWRVRRASLDPDEPDAGPTGYGIAAGKETWHHNKGSFHPADATYPVDEIAVVEIGYDRDYYTPEPAIPRIEDARLIALAPEMALLLAETVDWISGPIGGAAYDEARALLSRFEQLTQEQQT